MRRYLSLILITAVCISLTILMAGLSSDWPIDGSYVLSIVAVWVVMMVVIGTSSWSATGVAMGL